MRMPSLWKLFVLCFDGNSFLFCQLNLFLSVLSFCQPSRFLVEIEAVGFGSGDPCVWEDTTVLTPDVKGVGPPAHTGIPIALSD
jgi:hypothetical protein